MSGPDRFDAQARELVCKVDGMIYGHSDDERAAVIAAALRKAESSALERAAQHFKDRKCGKFGLIDRSDVVTELHRLASGLDPNIRALIPPAAAPAAETLDRHAEERHAAAMRTLDTIEESSRKIGERIDAQKRIAELEAALRVVERQTSVGPPSPPGRKTPGSGWYDLLVRVNAYVKGALAARTAPQTGGPTT